MDFEVHSIYYIDTALSYSMLQALHFAILLILNIDIDKTVYKSMRAWRIKI